MFDDTEADCGETEWVHPVQRDAGARRDSLASGERALILAILEEGLRAGLVALRVHAGRRAYRLKLRLKGRPARPMPRLW
jgi:hypothetical protein